MTRKKAIEVLKSECYVWPFLDGDRATLINTALDVAIEALKQESVLDKIRAEINSPNRGTCDYFIVDRIEEIIDKYKAGSED